MTWTDGKAVRRAFPFAILAMLTAGLLLVGVFGWIPERVDLDVGPGDADYASGLSAEWRLEGARTWREMRRKARIGVPLVLEGPGVLTVTLAQSRQNPTRLKVTFGDGTFDDIGLPGRPGFIQLFFAIPRGPTETEIVLESQGPDGGETPVRIDTIQWKGQRLYPQWRLAAGFLLIAVASFTAFFVAGASVRWSLTLTLLVAVLVSPVPPLVGFDSFTRLHLIRKGAAVALFGLAVVGLVRLLPGPRRATVSCLFYVALLVKAAFLFHPSFWFYDFPIHRTLLELGFHRGPVDFWTRLPEYQVIHNLGVAPVAGQYLAFPYPSLFYLLTNLANRPAHDPDFWLKLAGALASALAVFPVAALTRRLTTAPRADAFASLTYLLVPAYTRSLLLLEFSALLGHLLDLVALAYLARVALSLEARSRQAAAAAVMALALMGYTSGFLHFGLLVPLTLVLAIPLGGLTRRDGLRLLAVAFVAAGIGLLSYHPKTLSNIVTAVTAGDARAVTASPEGRSDAPLTRALTFVGVPVIVLGLAGVFLALRRPRSAPVRLLLAAWLAAGLVAYVLRYGFYDLFLYQKEIYFIGGVLAVGEGILVATLWERRGSARWLAVSLLSVTVGAYGWEIWTLLPRFYEKYLFL